MLEALLVFAVLTTPFLMNFIVRATTTDPGTKEIAGRVTKIAAINEAEANGVDVTAEADRIAAELEAEKEAEEARIAAEWQRDFELLSMTPEQRAEIEAEEKRMALEVKAKEEADKAELAKAVDVKTQSYVNVRQYPTPNSKTTSQYAQYHMARAVGWVRSVSINGIDQWFVDSSGGYVWAGAFAEVPPRLRELGHKEREYEQLRTYTGDVIRVETYRDPRTPEEIHEDVRRDLFNQNINSGTSFNLEMENYKEMKRDWYIDSMERKAAETQRTKQELEYQYQQMLKNKQIEGGKLASYAAGGWIMPSESWSTITASKITANKISFGTLAPEDPRIGTLAPEKPAVRSLKDIEAEMAEVLEEYYAVGRINAESVNDADVKLLTFLADRMDHLRAEKAERLERDKESEEAIARAHKAFREIEEDARATMREIKGIPDIVVTPSKSLTPLDVARIHQSNTAKNLLGAATL